jgi:hypothetical protein
MEDVAATTHARLVMSASLVGVAERRKKARTDSHDCRKNVHFSVSYVVRLKLISLIIDRDEIEKC